MSTYVIGDIQGCFLTFKKLLSEINFDNINDRAILLGDAINRGPRSLEMINFIKNNENQFEYLLGNHEIKALAIYYNIINKEINHTLQELLNAPNVDDLMLWLRSRPLLINKANNIFVHAGILPAISVKEAIAAAGRTETLLRGPAFESIMKGYFENRQQDFLSTILKDEAVLTLSYLTLIRMCKDKYSMSSYSKDLCSAPAGLKPWFELRSDEGYNIYFGHWAALGYFHYQNYCCLDSGCGWKKKLSAYCLEEPRLIQVDYCD